MLTLKKVNAALKQHGISGELVRAEGYFYFWGDDFDLTKEQGVYGVARLNDLSLERWLEEAKGKLSKSDER